MMDKIKVSEIRAKFPMYGDVSDDDLIIAIRKKYYSDIPLSRFVQSIDYDTERSRLDPTEGMSGFEKFAAGYGKAGTDLARGIGQWVGLSSREDVAESRKLDAPLLKTGAGFAGNLTGNIANTLPLAMLPGANTLGGAAAYGALTGAAAPSAGSGETAANIGLGGVLAPAAQLIGRGLSATYQAGRGLFDPLTKEGQKRIAASTLQSFATDPTKAAQSLRASMPLVPGSLPTIGQASRDPGLAQLERTLANNPETGGVLAQRYAEQRAARLSAVQNVAGGDDYYNAIKQGVRTFANEDYGAALKAGIDADAAKMLAPQIESLMRRPSIEQAKAVAKKLAAEQDIALDDFGSLQGMDWLKKALDNKISAAASPVSGIGKAELRSLVQTKDDLMSVIEQIAPGYKAANDNFAAMSRQVNSMDVARDLLKRYEPALSRYGSSTKEQADAYARALESATESVKKQTGMNKPLSQVMNTADIDALENVARDLSRKVSSENAGRAVGSNTAQNLAAQNLLRRTLGPTGLPQTWSENTALQTMLAPLTGIYKLGGAEQRVTGLLADAAQDPALAAELLKLSRQTGMPVPEIVNRLLMTPATAGLLVNANQ